ncbi:MAG: hypothetical protein H0V12_06470 [Chloroflexi bacterium]|nr:hypothetical protein [Chloroflexota bacterium]
MERLTPVLADLVASVLVRLPQGGLHRLAHVVGAGLYLARPARRSLVRHNLRRVCSWLAAEGMATPRVAAAARTDDALERLVRLAFGHYARAYLEMLVAPAYSRRELLRRIHLETPETIAEALGGSADDARSDAQTAGGVGRVLVGLHLGSLELPALYVAMHSRRPVVTPMEELTNRALQGYVERSRSATGVIVVPSHSARNLLRRTLRQGGTVALIADRPLASAAHQVTLFGAPARLPVGPALLALESGAATYVGSVRRVGWGTYAARLQRLPLPSEGSLRERRQVFMAAQIDAFQRLIAQAPEQWWTCFFRIWPDEPVARRVRRAAA